MKRLFLLCLLALFLQPVFAQKTNQCGFILPPDARASNFVSPYEAGKVITQILETINWKSNFVIQEQTGINNAYATIQNNKRYIIYDNIFFNNLDRYTGTQWASISVLAHEMGHHYLNHVFTGTNPARELEADFFSGYVLAKMGASLNDATIAIQSVSPSTPSASHPGKSVRVDAITRGWNYEGGPNPSNPSTTPASPTPKPQQTPPPNTSEEGWISLYLYGNADMTVYLSDDGRNYSPAPLNTRQPFVFRYEIYNYGFLRFVNSSQATTYKLVHGKDYAIIWNRKTNAWTVVVVQ